MGQSALRSVRATRVVDVGKMISCVPFWGHSALGISSATHVLECHPAACNCNSSSSVVVARRDDNVSRKGLGSSPVSGGFLPSLLLALLSSVVTATFCRQVLRCATASLLFPVAGAAVLRGTSQRGGGSDTDAAASDCTAGP